MSMQQREDFESPGRGKAIVAVLAVVVGLLDG